MDSLSVTRAGSSATASRARPTMRVCSTRAGSTVHASAPAAASTAARVSVFGRPAIVASYRRRCRLANRRGLIPTPRPRQLAHALADGALGDLDQLAVADHQLALHH